MTSKPELSRIINVADVYSSSKPTNISIKADGDELTALARRFGILGISLLEAEIKLSAAYSATEEAATEKGKGGGDVLAEVKLKTNLTQTCSVTTEPINSEIDASFSQVFSAAPKSIAESFGESLENEGFSEDSELFDLEASSEDAPEPIIGGVIDMGEFISQELSLRIDPFLRKKGVKFEWVSKNDEQGGAKDNPFAKLASLKDSLMDGKEPK